MLELLLIITGLVAVTALLTFENTAVVGICCLATSSVISYWLINYHSLPTIVGAGVNSLIFISAVGGYYRFRRP